MSFKNKVVLITGGSSGIGAATAELFAKEGADIAIVARNEVKLKNTAEKCEKLGAKVLIIKGDVAVDSDLKRIIKETINRFSKIDVLVNNAGIISNATIEDENLMEVYDKTINTNLRSTVYLTNLAVPYLIKTKGNVINISSILGVSTLGSPENLSYCVSKAGMDHFTRAAALQLMSSGVRVNTVSPGVTRTDVLSNAGIDAAWEDTAKKFNVERVIEAEEVGDLIVFLASDKARSITGSNYYIDSGALLKN
ncbi:unnamed protein product [Chrysodeixis includens]|uniref:Ketoreductase domain-containing protein n=1 Tax=Chrysodeixis includens TaxID=689277 RepID=A0A9P0FVJ6_CHRIL|nr:unnamed protein product [Chrysodeixis includens]